MPSCRGSAHATRTGASGSSTTSSRTSTSSSTSDPSAGRPDQPDRPEAAARLAGLVRLTHPFPSILDGVVVGAVALVAGADPAAALRLGISMTALQASIGTVNDLVDVALDTGRKPGKPIPAGLVSIRGARIAAIGWAALGLGLAAVSGPALLALAGVVLGIGYGYDVWAKGTPWSWLPFALGIPILPVYGWYGATGALADWFLVLVPAAMVAGGSLAIANARADAERDASAGSGSIAVALGDGRAWLIHAIGLALVIVVATGWLVAAGGPIPPLALVLLAVGTATIASGVSLGQGTAAAARLERAWELEAVGVAILAIGWLWAVAG